MTRQETIVVGYDESEHAREAVRFAVAEAARRGAQVVAVRAFEAPERWWVEGYQVIVAPNLSEVTTNVEARTRALLRTVAEELGGDALRVPTDAIAVTGSPAKALLDRARDAALLVVGHRGRGTLASTVLGSVSLHCVLHAHCPVTVVPAQPVRERAVEPAGAAPVGIDPLPA